MMRYCREAQDAELVAICDNWEEGLRKKQSELGDGVACYTSLDDFLQHDMDAVVLANYATEHAPLAIRAMEQGFHVISEVLPCQTMKEAVELVEAVERTGKIYAYAENYCFMAAPHEMRALYRAGKRAGLRLLCHGSRASQLRRLLEAKLQRLALLQGYRRKLGKHGSPDCLLPALAGAYRPRSLLRSGYAGHREDESFRLHPHRG